MKPVKFIAACLVIVGAVGCTQWWGGRSPASSHTLPPAKPAGVEHAPNDEPPILNTPNGYVRSEPPRSVPKKKPKPKVFRGTSD